MNLFKSKKIPELKKIEQIPNQNKGHLYESSSVPSKDEKPVQPQESKNLNGLPKKPKIIDPIIELYQKKLNLLDLIAPESIEIDFDYIKINNSYFRTIFVAGYPRFVAPGWLEPIINFDGSLDISFYLYPVEGKTVLDDLRRKIAEMEAEIATDLERGKIVDPSTQAKLEDARNLQEQLVKGAERFFQFSFYITIPALTLEELNQLTRQVESTLGSILVVAKHATLDMENANMTIFATSGAGKSYFVKLEALRSLMIGTEVIVIDPESEYKALADAAGGEFISFSFSSPSKINPFDLSQIYEAGENQLGLKILSLHSLFKVIMGSIPPSQEALLVRALVSTYRAKGITQDPATQKKEPPLMEDLYKTLIGMETAEAMDLAARIEKFVRGSFVGIFDKQANVNIKIPFTVFSVKDLQDALRPIAMFIILHFIWTKVKKDLKKRLLVVDEAWHMMRYPDSAQFLWSVVKRARKYYLGLTTITQDVEDFLNQDIGKAIVTNSSLRLLLKQSPAAIDKIGEVFYLSQGEKQLLLAANIGEGIFFAGPHHAPIRIVASEEEHKIITTKPQEKLGYYHQANKSETNINPSVQTVNKN